MEVNTFVVNNVGWDAAIRDAESQLARAREKVQRFQDVIAVFTQKMNSGEPWPGQLRDQSASQQHSE